MRSQPIFICILTIECKYDAIFVKLQSSLTVQSKSVGLGVDFVFPPSQLSK